MLAPSAVTSVYRPAKGSIISLKHHLSWPGDFFLQHVGGKGRRNSPCSTSCWSQAALPQLASHVSDRSFMPPGIGDCSPWLQSYRTQGWRWSMQSQEGPSWQQGMCTLCAGTADQTHGRWSCKLSCCAGAHCTWPPYKMQRTFVLDAPCSKGCLSVLAKERHGTCLSLHCVLWGFSAGSSWEHRNYHSACPSALGTTSSSLQPCSPFLLLCTAFCLPLPSTQTLHSPAAAPAAVPASALAMEKEHEHLCPLLAHTPAEQHPELGPLLLAPVMCQQPLLLTFPGDKNWFRPCSLGTSIR